MPRPSWPRRQLAEAEEIAAPEAEMPSEAVLSDLDLPEVVPSDAASPEEAADLGEETLLDEETLRAMIRQAVCEELQGVLGRADHPQCPQARPRRDQPYPEQTLLRVSGCPDGLAPSGQPKTKRAPMGALTLRRVR